MKIFTLGVALLAGISGCAASTSSPPSGALNATTTPSIAKSATWPGDTVEVFVYAGQWQCGGLLIYPQEIPVFVKEFVGNRRVVLRPGVGCYPSQLVEARDRLKAEGVSNIFFGPNESR